MELFHYLLPSLCVAVPSLQETFQGSFFLGLPTILLHCLDLDEHTSSYLECGLKTTRQLVYNYALVYHSKCHVCRSPSEQIEAVAFAEYLLLGPHYIRGDNFVDLSENGNL